MATAVGRQWKADATNNRSLGQVVAHPENTVSRLSLEEGENAELETYSTASSLEHGEIRAYVSEFAEELRGALPPNLGKDGWDKISPVLGDILKEFSVRIAYEETLADRTTCRMIMYLVHRYHR
jgi:hypothetical protein